MRGEEGQWQVVTPPELLLRLVVPSAIASLRSWLERAGAHVDVAALRREHPALLDFELWFRAQGYETRALPPASASPSPGK